MSESIEDIKKRLVEKEVDRIENIGKMDKEAWNHYLSRKDGVIKRILKKCVYENGYFVFYITDTWDHTLIDYDLAPTYSRGGFLSTRVRGYDKGISKEMLDNIRNDMNKEIKKHLIKGIEFSLWKDGKNE